MAVSRDVAEAVIRLVGEDQVREIIQSTNKDLDETTRRTEEANKASRDLGKTWDSLTGQIDDVRRSVGLLAAQEIAGMVADAARAVADVAREGARELAVAADFERRFRGQADALGQLRAAAQGMLDDGALRAIGSETQRAGMSLEQTTRLLAAASRVAISTGGDAADLARDLAELARGTADEAEEGLKRLGIVADVGAAQARYAAALGLTTGQLTKQQQAAASLDTVLREVDKSFAHVTGDEAYARLSRLERAWANVTASIKAGAVDAVNSVFDLPGKLADAIVGIDKAVAQQLGPPDTTRRGGRWRAVSQQLTEDVKALAEAEEQRLRAQAARYAAADARTQQLAQTLIAEEKARLAAVEHAADLAHMAQVLGLATVASEKWRDALVAADTAGIDLAANTRLLAAAVAGSNDEMARALELQAALAEAEGDVAGASALRAQAAGRLLGDGSTTKPLPGRGGGGGRRATSTDTLNATLEQDLAAMREQVAQGMADMQAAAAGFDALIAEQRAKAELDLYAEQLRAYQDAEAARIESMRLGLDSLRESTLALRDALGEVGGIDLGGLADAFGGLDELAAQWAAVGDAAGKSGNAMTVGALGAAAATGKMVAGIIKDQRAQAVIMALVEQAEAWASFGRADYVGFGAHLASSALWGVVAGKGSGGGGAAAGGGRGTRGTGARIPGDTAQQQPREMAATPITVHVSGGTYLGTKSAETGRELGAMIGDAATRGTRDPGRARGPG